MITLRPCTPGRQWHWPVRKSQEALIAPKGLHAHASQPRPDAKFQKPSAHSSHWRFFTFGLQSHWPVFRSHCLVREIGLILNLEESRVAIYFKFVCMHLFIVALCARSKIKKKTIKPFFDNTRIETNMHCFRKHWP